MDVGEGARRVTANEAVTLAAAALRATGADASVAELQAAHLVEAELRGHPSHGLRRLPVLVARIRAGLIDPNARPTFRWGAQGALSVDGNRGFGPVAAYSAIDELLSRVDVTGIAAASMRGTHHLGMLAPYVERMSERGCIGLVLSSTEGLVHPWGGSGPLLGTNPLAASVPAARDRITLDMATGSVSAGKIADYAQRGKVLPEGWAIDESGRSTQDAAAASKGAISPFGGAKGYALGLTLGAIVGVLTGTSYGPEVQGTLDSTHETSKGDVIVAISIGAFGQDAESKTLAVYLDRIRSSGVDSNNVAIPGDRSRANRERALAEGFDVIDEVWSALVDFANASRPSVTAATGMNR